MEEKEYKVKWEIEVYADSPEEAAEKAFNIRTKQDTTATVYNVTDPDGNMIEVDLIEEEDEEFDYDKQPEQVKEILDKYQDEDPDYRILAQISKELLTIGYDMDYGLDGQILSIKKVKDK
jgi:hypothetical protein